jgi:hypothetical protein
MPTKPVQQDAGAEVLEPQTHDPSDDLLVRASALGIDVEIIGLDGLDAEAVEALVESVEAAVQRASAAAGAAPVPLVNAIAHAMAEAGEVTKSSVNADQGYKFASAEAILAAVRRPLLTRGVMLTTHPKQYTTSTIKSDGRGTRIIIDVDFVFRDGTGAELRIEDWRGVGEDYGDKAIGKAYTSAVKTFVRTNWLLPTEHDDPERTDNAAPAADVAIPAWALEASDARKAQFLEALEVLVGRDVARGLGKSIKAGVGVVPEILVKFARGLTAAYLDAPDSELLARRVKAHEAKASSATRAAQDAAAEAPDMPTPDPGPDEPGPDTPDRPPSDQELDEETIDALERSDDETLQFAAANHLNERVRELASEVLAGRELERVVDTDEPPPADPDEPERPAAGSVQVGDLPGNPALAYGVLKAAGCICDDPLKTKSEHGKLNDTCPVAGHGIPF